MNHQDTVPSDSALTPAVRWCRAGHKGCILWFTGLSGAGKSTLAREVERRLFARGYYALVLDGDSLRATLNSDLGFGAEDRSENVRRIAEVARLFAFTGHVAIVASISPYRKDRELARSIAGQSACDFHETFADAPFATCEARDPKGLYRRARAGEIRQFTGLDSAYERPEAPELHLRTDNSTIEQCVERVLDYLTPRLRIDFPTADAPYEI
jgi:adenylyl-sulfate kinase